MINPSSRLKLLLLVVAAVIPASLGATDDTLTELSRGKEVAEAALRKISKANIFLPDNSFFTRLAYVESRYGEDNTTFRSDYYGGIWQVEESVFQLTQDNSSQYFFGLTKSIQERLQIDWFSVTWRDLTRPLYSALAAALYFSRVTEQTAHYIPETVGDQAKHWQTYYRPLGVVGKFQNDSDELRNETRCRGKMDLAIVLDGSGSINLENFKKAQAFVASLIESFSLDYTRMGMLIFNALPDPQVVFEINNNFTIKQMADLVLAANYPAGGTRTDIAVHRAMQMFNASAGTRGDGVPKVMTVFTDGQSDQQAEMPKAYEAIRNNSVKSIAIGIGGGIEHEELFKLALNDSSSVFQLSNFNNLQDFLQKITSVTCEIPQEALLDRPYNDTLVQNESRLYRLIPPLGGITINITITVGRTSGYWSYTDSVPSSAVNDGVIEGLTYIPAPPGTQRQEGEEGEEEEAYVYFAVVGVDEENSYSVTMVEGNHVPEDGGDNNGAAVTSLTAISMISVFVLHCLLH